MTATTSIHCNRAGCANSAPPALSSAQLCLDHFLDEASVRAERAFENCQQGHSLQSDELEWLLSDALATVKQLIAKNADGRSLGFLGEPGVNVLKLNIALDKAQAAK